MNDRIATDRLASIHQRYLEIVDRALVRNHALFLRIVEGEGVSGVPDGQPIPAAAAETTQPHDQVVPVLLALVAETTGYPADTLAPDMDMEADLAIDSIKRFEILIALRERFPHLPELDTDTVARLRTLDDVFAALGALADETPDLFDSVAALTSYPVEMLDPEMVLGADLGLDNDTVTAILERFLAPVTGPKGKPDATWTLAELAGVIGGQADEETPG